jgi:hypothetical protein
MFKTLKFLVTKSISTGVQYVKLDEEKPTYVSGKWFFSCMFAQFAEAGKNRSKAVHLLEKSVINMI